MLRSSSAVYPAPSVGIEGWLTGKPRNAIVSGNLFKLKTKRSTPFESTIEKDKQYMVAALVTVNPPKRKAIGRIKDPQPLFQSKQLRTTMLDVIKKQETLSPVIETLSPVVEPRNQVLETLSPVFEALSPVRETLSPVLGQRMKLEIKKKLALLNTTPKKTRNKEANQATSIEQTYKEKELKEKASQKKAIRDFVRGFYKNTKKLADKFSSLRLDTKSEQKLQSNLVIKTEKPRMANYITLKERDSRNSSLDRAEAKTAKPGTRASYADFGMSPKIIVTNILKGANTMDGRGNNTEGKEVLKTSLGDVQSFAQNYKESDDIRFSGRVISFKKNSNLMTELVVSRPNKRFITATRSHKLANPLNYPLYDSAGFSKPVAPRKALLSAKNLHQSDQLLLEWKVNPPYSRSVIQVGDLEDQKEWMSRMRHEQSHSKLRVSKEQSRNSDLHSTQQYMSVLKDSAYYN